MRVVANVFGLLNGRANAVAVKEIRAGTRNRVVLMTVWSGALTLPAVSKGAVA